MLYGECSIQWKSVLIIYIKIVVNNYGVLFATLWFTLSPIVRRKNISAKVSLSLHGLFFCYRGDKCL